ncbi:MAG: thioredoxin domain-containing protein [bacterium]
MNKKRFRTLYRIGIVVLLFLIVAIVLVLRNKKPRDIEITDVPIDSSATGDSMVKEDSFIQISNTDTATAKVSQGNPLPEQAISVPPEEAKEILSHPENVLAEVNGEVIAVSQFDSIFNALPQQAKDYFKDDKAGFLEELIARQLLLQDARRKKIQEKSEYKTAVAQNPGQAEDILINRLIQNMVSKVSLTENELKEFFEQHKDQFPNKDYESVKEKLRPMAIEEKQRLTIEQNLNELELNTKIIRNEVWIKKQVSLIPDNPLNKALKSGKAVVADFGRGTCMPCKMMEPILKKLQKDYEGKASILILDVGEYASLSQKYGVRMIPTQIFFDANGKEVYRHQGFMPEEDIVAQLKKTGVE